MNRFRIIVLFLLLLASSRIHAQNIFLVSVGVADYPGDRDDLGLPVHDAEDMYDLFSTNKNATSVLFTDSTAKRNRILNESRKLFSRAGKNDIVILFFSGHGYPGGFAAYDGPLSYEDIRRLFSGCKAKNKMIFADTCFSGAIRENSGEGFNDPKNDIMLFLSSRSNEVSNENRRFRNGFFTTCLLRSLKGGADTDKDRIITAKELYHAVSSGVIRLSQNRQHPVMWGNFKDTMPVMVWK